MDFDKLVKGINPQKIEGQATINYAKTWELRNQKEREQMQKIQDLQADTFRRREEERLANIETAENTAEMKQDLKEVIHNQNRYIKMLEKENQQLKDIFVSGEDGVAVQKEIMKILQEQNVNDGLLADKGLDAVVQSIFLGIQIWLKTKGIDF